MLKYSSYLGLILLIFFLACETDRDDYLRKNSNKLLKVSADSISIEADGVSSTRVTAVLGPDADKKLVDFTTDNGEFGDSSQKASVEAGFEGDSLVATAVLQSSLEVKETVKITASISGITKNASLRFARAYPDSLQLESTIASIPSGFGSEVPLQALLLRKKGIPSLHHQVRFHAIKDNNSGLGEFRGIDAAGSNDKGIVNAVYVLKDTTYKGPVRIIASTATKMGSYNDTLLIHVIK